ncbi:MAG: AraC family transcriptional regulator [Aquisalinus sp.]|nr:AraC family transcriptional regulator [Aquisalinus sp.]
MTDLPAIDIGWRSALMFSVCLPIVLAALFIVSRDVERKATIWLALFLIAAVTGQIPQIIGFAGFYDRWPGLTFAPFSTELYLGPLLYLHADRLMRDGPLGWRKWLLAPGLVQTTYYTACFLFLGDYKNKWAYNDAFHEPYIIPLETLVALGLMCWSLFAIYELTKRYRAYLAATQSASLDFEPVWLTRLVIALIPAALVFSGMKILISFIMPISYVAAFPFEVLIMACLVWLAFDALTRLHEPFPKLGPLLAEPTASNKAEKDWVKEGALLRKAVLKGEWHLEPRLTISDVAERRATNETYVSRAVNRGLGQTFTEMINDMRIDHARKLLTQTDATILEIALSAGFNSKATFNRVFKERENITPSQYRTSQKQ